MSIKTRTILIVALLALCSSCSKQWSPAVDPLKGWNAWGEHDKKRPALDKAIRDDYQNYLQKNEPGFFPSALGATFYEDGAGQHAVNIRIGRNGSYTIYIFIYDKSNLRIKVMRFSDGGYAC